MSSLRDIGYDFVAALADVVDNSVAAGATQIDVEFVFDGAASYACLVPVASVGDRQVVTIEGLSSDSTHAVQQAWIEETVPQCGYCQSGQIMQAASLLKKNPNPSREEIVADMNGNICRCGTYQRIVRAVERAAQEA